HWGIGDLIMTTPLLQALHGALPEAQIEVVLGLAGAAEVLQGAEYATIRGIIRRQSGLGKLFRFFVGLRKARYDVAVMATRVSPRMGQLARFVAGIPTVIGDGTGPRPAGYTAWREMDPLQHRVEGNIEIGRLLVDIPGIPHPRVEITPAAAAAAAERWQTLTLAGRPVLAVHPGSSHVTASERRIPETLVDDTIASLLGLLPGATVLVVLGPEELSLLPRFEGRDPRLRVLSGASLQETAWILGRCDVLLAGDSGLGHMASAVGTPVVTLGGPTQTAATRPWGDHTTVVRTREPLACMPCYDTPLYGRCPYQVKCLTSIERPQVLEAIHHALRPRPELSSA
ncbi:MAG TPA: glycosyltransferase family 9 protein, partial [Gemmatimonadales bacterium]|nr:glycosyltransferase family 9 protein [Gemmatimonadales bacterium]